MATELDLAVDIKSAKEQSAKGFGTPATVTAGQKVRVRPTRAIPVIFLPGVMGSNLRIASEERMRLLKRDPNEAESNIAWRPDNLGVMNVSENADRSAAQRQLILDPDTTAVDIYTPRSGNPDRDGDGRNGNVDLDWSFSSPLMTDADRIDKEQKARRRGWGQTYFESYGDLLQTLEQRLNRMFKKSMLGNRVLASGWDEIVGVDPKKWLADPSIPTAALTEPDLLKIGTDCWFPVYAIGYNWLQSNRVSASVVAGRIRSIHDAFVKREFDCPGVIVVTHSMGGLLGRSLIHPDHGALNDLVLGVIHGVQPAIGAAAAYKRMHAGVEGSGLADRVVGDTGELVTAVVANSPGGLQLLPSPTYGNGWLKVMLKGQQLLSLPAKGDPYEEIYKVRHKWYGLLPTEDWINPAKAPPGKLGKPGFQRTTEFLDAAKAFHADIDNTYHSRSYVHYGADKEHKAFGCVTWQISDNCRNPNGWQDWPIVGNSKRGMLTFAEFKSAGQGPQHAAFGDAPRNGAYNNSPITATIQPPDEAGDETVPIRSADHQMRVGRPKAVFRQVGYDHQDSYKDDKVIHATIYSILRIALEVSS